MPFSALFSLEQKIIPKSAMYLGEEVKKFTFILMFVALSERYKALELPKTSQKKKTSDLGVYFRKKIYAVR